MSIRCVAGGVFGAIIILGLWGFIGVVNDTLHQVHLAELRVCADAARGHDTRKAVTWSELKEITEYCGRKP